jgi:hypothetical protein
MAAFFILAARVGAEEDAACFEDRTQFTEHARARGVRALSPLT